MRGDQYETSWFEYLRTWEAFDQVLYRMCAAMPRHDTLGWVAAKVGIISRAYATGLERHVETNKMRKVNGLVIVAHHLHRNGPRVDDLMSRLRRIARGRVLRSPEQLRETVRVHSELLSLVREVIREGHIPRSFVSKYMHFHAPAVPIFDFRAMSVLRHWYPVRRKRSWYFTEPTPSDSQYYRFCNRIFSFWLDAKRHDPQVTIRRLDQYLLWFYDKEMYKTEEPSWIKK